MESQRLINKKLYELDELYKLEKLDELYELYKLDELEKLDELIDPLINHPTNDMTTP